MANLVRTSRGRRSASGQYRMAILASSAAAAAGVSVTQALLRRRYAERAAQARRDADLGAGNDAPRIAAGPGNHAAGEPNGQPGEPERTQEAHRALRRNRPLLRVSRYLLPARFHRQDDRGLPEAERALSP